MAGGSPDLQSTSVAPCIVSTMAGDLQAPLLTNDVESGQNCRNSDVHKVVDADTSCGEMLGHQFRTPTLMQKIQKTLIEKADKCFYAQILDTECNTRVSSYRQIHADSDGVRSYLKHHLQLNRNDKVMLVFMEQLEFASSFLACIKENFIAVPCYPPDPSKWSESITKLEYIAKDCGATTCIFDSNIYAMLSLVIGIKDTFRRFGVEHLVNAKDAIAYNHDDNGNGNGKGKGNSIRGEIPSLNMMDEVAYLQYTSGSTGNPKGVMITYDGLNYQLTSTKDYRENAIACSWVPVFHDWGLCDFLLRPLAFGYSSYFFSPLMFIKKPILWLEVMTKFKCTYSGMPNFAFDLVRKKFDEEKKRGKHIHVDLSAALTISFGGEPVRKSTIESFCAYFSEYGFCEETIFLGYGLAEATLCVAPPPFVYAKDITGFYTSPTSKRTGLCGYYMRAPERMDLRIVDPETCVEVPEGGTGEVWVHCRSVSPGYWNMPELSEEIFRARINQGDSSSGDSRSSTYSRTYLRTGDQGFIVGDELFICGRIKDIIIIRGRNIYPNDVEYAIQECDSRLRPGCLVCFETVIEGLEGIDCVAELRSVNHTHSELETITDRIANEVAMRFSVSLCMLVLLLPRSLPKTSSGKVRRKATREMLREDERALIRLNKRRKDGCESIDAGYEVSYGANTHISLGAKLHIEYIRAHVAISEKSVNVEISELPECTKSTTDVQVLSTLIAILCVVIDSTDNMDALTFDSDPRAVGLDSIGAGCLCELIATHCGVNLDTADVLQYSSLGQLVAIVQAQRRGKPTPSLDASEIIPKYDIGTEANSNALDSSHDMQGRTNRLLRSDGDRGADKDSKLADHITPLGWRSMSDNPRPARKQDVGNTEVRVRKWAEKDVAVKYYALALVQLVCVFIVGLVVGICAYPFYLLLAYQLDSPFSMMGKSLAAFVVLINCQLIGFVIFKWVILGRQTPGRHPVYGFYYWRWWMVGLHFKLITAVLRPALLDSLITNCWYRCLGARIGVGARLDGLVFSDWDLVEIGCGTKIRTAASIQPCNIAHGYLIFSRISIGADCLVEQHTAILGDAELPDRIIVEELQSVVDGKLTTGEPFPDNPFSAAPNPPRKMKASPVVVFLLWCLFLIVLGLMVMTITYGVYVANFNANTGSTRSMVELALLIVIATVTYHVMYGLLVVILKRLMLSCTSGRRKQGDTGMVVSTYGDKLARKLMNRAINNWDKMFFEILKSPYYAALGANISTSALLSVNVFLDDPESITIESDCLLGGGVQVKTSRTLDNGDILIEGATVRSKATIGVRNTVPVGCEIGAGAMVQPFTHLTSSVGFCAVANPAKVFTPAIKHERYIPFSLLTFWVTAMTTFVLNVFCQWVCFFIAILAYASFGDYDLFVLAFGVSAVAFFLTSAIMFVLVKWTVLGKLKTGELNRRSRRYLQYQIFFMLTVVNIFPSMLAGGPLFNIFLNVLGANVDMTAVISNPNIYDFDLLTIEADCYVGRLATLSPHVINAADNVTLKHVRVCRGSYVGAWAWLEGGQILSEGTMLGPCSRLGQGKMDADNYKGNDDGRYLLCGVPAVRRVHFNDGTEDSRAPARHDDRATMAYDRL